MTGLPIIETKANDISAYIPTNVISITDGQCFLETDLFNQGVRPAINVGVSVSRVGGAAQIKAMKEVAGSLRLDLSQYRELEAFAAFASDLDETSKAQLERGARLVELLKQPQYSPMSVEDQVVAIFLGTKGHLDSVPVADVSRFEAEFIEHLKASGSSILGDIKSSQKLTEETEAALESTVADFKKGFATSDGSSVIPDAHVAAMSEDEVEGSRSGPQARAEEEVMAATLRELRGRIRSAGSIKKITKAQELIATSRIAKAQARVEAARPYSTEITHMLTNLAAESALDHPLLVAREKPKRAAVLVVSSDRGLCGAYNANVLRRAEGVDLAAPRGGQRAGPLRCGPKGAGLLQFPQLDDHPVVDRFLGEADLREVPGDRRHPGGGLPATGADDG